MPQAEGVHLIHWNRIGRLRVYQIGHHTIRQWLASSRDYVACIAEVDSKPLHRFHIFYPLCSGLVWKVFYCYSWYLIVYGSWIQLSRGGIYPLIDSLDVFVANLHDILAVWRPRAGNIYEHTHQNRWRSLSPTPGAVAHGYEVLLGVFFVVATGVL